MANLCIDCIQAGAVQAAQSATTPCEGLTLTITDHYGTYTVTPVVTSNLFSLTGYDISYSDPGGNIYNIVYTGSQWVIVNSAGVKIAYSASIGPFNNACPPKDGWVITAGVGVISIGVDFLEVPGPSGPCTVTNGTFDSTTSGWVVVNGAWDSSFGGAVRFSSNLVGSLTQSGVLTIGETYNISFDYIAQGNAGYCTPTQYNAGYIKVYAGTNVITKPLIATSNEPSGAITLNVELTCQATSDIKIEVYDPFLCYGTSAGGKGVFIDKVCAELKTNVTDPVGPSPLPSVEFLDQAEVPAQIFGKDFNTVQQSFSDCLATKGTTFYNKIVGGVKCDYRELTKLKLILELLSQRDQDRSLDCIYDRMSIPTVIYPDLPTGSLPVLTQNQTTFKVTGDISQFEAFNFHIQAVTDYGVLSGVVVSNTTSNNFFIPPGGLPFSILGYSFSLLNNLGDSYATAAINVVTNIQYNQPGPPLNNTVTVLSPITSPALYSVANSTIWTLYAPVTSNTTPVDFTSRILNAVYDVATNKTTVTIEDPLPGIIGGATYKVEFVAENTNTYLQTFTDFLNRFCADCMLTNKAISTTSGEENIVDPNKQLTTESGIPVTTEFNLKITL